MADEDLARSPRAQTSGTLEEASETISAAADKAAHLAHRQLNDLGDHLGNVYPEGTDRARDTLDELPATLSDAAVAGGRLLRHGRRSLDGSVRKQPVEALLLAGALGYLAGWAVGRG